MAVWAQFEDVQSMIITEALQNIQNCFTRYQMNIEHEDYWM